MTARNGRTTLIKVWGRNTSSNVQKVMWAVEEIGLPHERIDIGGPFGKNREPAYLAMNPNGLVPTLEEDDVVLALGIEFHRALPRGQASRASA